MKLKTASEAMIRAAEEQMVQPGSHPMVRVPGEQMKRVLSQVGLTPAIRASEEDLSLMDPKLAAAKASGAYPSDSRLQAHLFKRHPNT